jgi:hypothetical protein
VVLLPAILSSAKPSPRLPPTQAPSTQGLPATQRTLLLLTQARLYRYRAAQADSTCPYSRHTGQATPQSPTMDRTIVVHQAKLFLQSLAGSTHGQNAKKYQPKITRRTLLRELLSCSGLITLESSVDFSTSGSKTGYTTGQTVKAMPRSMCRRTSWISSTAGQTRTELPFMRPQTTVRRQRHLSLLRQYLQLDHRHCHHRRRRRPYRLPALWSPPARQAL